MPDRLRYIVGGQIAASDINEELNRGGQMAIWEARNGYYGGINDASGYRPFANGQSGYEYNDWWGYTHSASRPYVYIFKYEAEVSVSIRLYKYNPYGGQEWGEQWYFYNTGPWTNASDVTGVPVRMDDRVTFLWNHFGWGNYWRTTFKAVYSTSRGYIIYWGCDPGGYQRYAEINPVWSGEVMYCYSVEYYC